MGSFGGITGRIPDRRMRYVLNTFFMTDIGKRRKFNQDYVYTSEQPLGRLPNLFLVADGMGGHNAGDYASKYTVETIAREIAASDEADPQRVLQHAIEVANGNIRQKAMENSELIGMGTTLVAATCTEEELMVGNVGDSRLYVINDRITQITRDHSLVEEMVRMGGIDRKLARNHPDKNIITRAIGASQSIEVDFFTVKLEKGDIVLMCSDGLTNMLEDEDIRLILSAAPRRGGQQDLMEKAQELIKTANNNGGKDNIAVILIEPFAQDER